jgi:hypothetical protein
MNDNQIIWTGDQCISAIKEADNWLNLVHQMQAPFLYNYEP